MEKFPTIIIYKSLHPGEKLIYEWYDYHTGTRGTCNEFQGLASAIRKHILREGGLYTISFSTPPGEMSCPPPEMGEPFLCVPFNEKEKLAFFREYTSTGQEQN